MNNVLYRNAEKKSYFFYPTILGISFNSDILFLQVMVSTDND